MSVADEIKSKLDIVQYIQRYVPLKKAGRSWKAPCPFHAERTPSFVVNEQNQTWRCFGACAEGGDIFKFAMKYHGWSFTEALQELGKLAGVETRQQTPEQRQQSEALDRLRGLMKSAADHFHDVLFDARNPAAVATLDYARKKRGLSDETLHRFQIGFAPAGWQITLDALKALGYSEDDLIATGMASRNEESGRVYDRFRNRLMIPIRDDRGRVVGFGARALAAEDNPKYLNSPQSPLFDKSKILFGLDFAKQTIRDSEVAVIVEGYLDAIQAHQAGYTNVVAQMGTALTEPQLKLLASRLAKRIILSLDSDAAGQNATRRSLEVARETLQADYAGRLSVDMRILVVPGAKDPDDLIRETPEVWPTLVEDALPVADYVIAQEMETLSEHATVQEREAVARRLLPILAATENDLYRSDNLQKLAVRLRIPEDKLLMWASDQQKIAAAKAPHEPIARRQPEPPQSPPADDDFPEFDTPRTAQRGQTTPADNLREAALEAYCLKLLFMQPKLIYDVNRKFRELAGTNSALAEQVLGDLSSDDFTRTSYRALMDVFAHAIVQDEQDVLEYLHAALTPDLMAELETVLADEWEEWQLRRRNAFYADLMIVVKQSERFSSGIDSSAEMIEKALRLRIERLRREREEFVFLGTDGTDIRDAPYQRHITLSILAKQLIEAELNHRSQVLRQ
ncbi:MAG TPA: DNA primase [Phototrophicaceae bacterium]|nr:DNA primase [Phototrophicaceae bacterium]